MKRLLNYELIFEDTLIPLEDINSIEAIEDIDEIAFYIINDQYRVIRVDHPKQVAVIEQWLNK